MKEFFKKHWTTALVIILVGIAIFLPFYGINRYYYWKELTKSKTDNYDGINVAISFCAGILNVITIIFLYINYVVQKKQIEDAKKDADENRRDSEFSRVLEIVYKQIDLTNDKIKSSTTYSLVKKEYEKPVTTGYEPYNDLYSEDENVESLFKELDELFNIFYYILKNNTLTMSQRFYLRKIIEANIGVYFFNFTVWLIKEYEGKSNYQKSIAYLNNINKIRTEIKQ